MHGKGNGKVCIVHAKVCCRQQGETEKWWCANFWWCKSDIKTDVELKEQKDNWLGHESWWMSSLHDAYLLVDEVTAGEQTRYIYILQFLWRDLTSSFDIIGPYFTISSPLESKFIFACFQTVKLFYLYWFHTSVLVYNEAGTSVSALSQCVAHQEHMVFIPELLPINIK